MRKIEPILTALGFGGNLGDPVGAFLSAFEALKTNGIGRLIDVSSLWRTPPWGDRDQPAFLNVCALVETRKNPVDLLLALKELEKNLGRSESRRWGPRLVDIDILFYGELVLETPLLTLPHKHLFDRAFVLTPLSEIIEDAAPFGSKIRAARTRLKTDENALECIFDERFYAFKKRLVKSGSNIAEAKASLIEAKPRFSCKSFK